MAQQDKKRQAYGKVVARTWRDPAFKAKLMADPQGTLTGAGITVPAGATVTILENTATHFHLVLPPKPMDALSDDALDSLAGGVMHCGGCSSSDYDP